MLLPEIVQKFGRIRKSKKNKVFYGLKWNWQKSASFWSANLIFYYLDDFFSVMHEREN